MIYDKALWLFAKIFLENQELEEIKNMIVNADEFQYVYLDPDIDQRRQLTNKICIITEGENLNVNSFDCLLKKSVNFLEVEMEDFKQ